jgi:uncharacterized protein (DUF1330 family)
MPAYVIASVMNAWDQDALTEYRRRNTDSVAAHGGRFLVRGGEQEVLEGDWRPLRLVIIEFPDMAAARGWYESDEYVAIRGIRQGASDTDVVLVDGNR